MNFVRKKLINMQKLIKMARRELHQIPEIGYNEFETQRFIIKFLEKYGISYQKIAKTGVVAVIYGEDKSEATAFRTDIDGLGILEDNDHEFTSKHQGMMHACGHDGHMAMALGLLYYIVEYQVKLKKNLVVIFQPAEEGPGGAEVIISEGVLKDYHIKDIFGYHLFPNVEENCFSSRRGPLMARTGEFDIEITTIAAHGAMPHLGVDAALIASELMIKIQSIISRTINPIEPAVITVGHITIGEARNAIANHARLEGTARAFSEEVFKQIREYLNKYSNMFADEKVEVKVEFREMYPEVNNDGQLLQSFVEGIDSKLYIESSPQMIAEDFSYYQKEIPGLFVFLGIKNDEKGFNKSLHHAQFDFDETVLLSGVEAYIRYLETRGIIDGK